MKPGKNILRGELIGKKAEITDSKNKANVGILGTITDETKFTITIGEKKLMKNNITIKIGKFRVEGSKLVNRPEDRIKVK